MAALITGVLVKVIARKIFASLRLQGAVAKEIKRLDGAVKKLQDELNRRAKTQLGRDSEAVVHNQRDNQRDIIIGNIIFEFRNVKEKFKLVVAYRGFNKSAYLLEINSVIEEIDYQMYLLHNHPEGERSESNPEGDRISSEFNADLDFVGREEDMNALKSLLNADDPKLQFIAICGSLGSGKTALAYELFHDSETKLNFVCRVWVNVPVGCETLELLRFIYQELCHSDTAGMTPDALVREINQVQEVKKCLIVLDGLWSSDARVRLRQAFPSGKSSKILITTQVVEVADNMGAKIYTLRCLSEEDGLQLFLKAARRIKHTQHQELECRKVEDIGKDVVNLCEGLPLSIVESVRKALDHPCADWNHELFAKTVHDIAKEEPVLKELSLCFENLPHFLSRCFLYLGLVEDDSMIDAESLYMLWLGDGRILPQFCEGEEILMNVAEQYLNRLAGRSMIEVQEAEVPTITKLGSWKLNSLMHELLRVKNQEQGFIKGLGSEDGSHHQRAAKKTFFYQVSINVGKWQRAYEYEWSKWLRKKSKHIHCMLLSADKGREGGLHWPKELYGLFRFESLKILTFIGFDFGKIKLPKGIGALVKLRYLSFKDCHLSRLPSSVQNLELLEILDLRVDKEIEMVIPNVLRRLRKLKHLYFPSSFKTERPHELLRLDGLENVETITNMNTQYVNAEDLFGLLNLCYIDVIIPSSLEKTQRIAERVTTTIGFRSPPRASIKISNFDCYADERRTVLAKLLGCPSLMVLDMSGYICRLPWSQGVDSNLVKVVLVDSELMEDSMETLKKLTRLRVLVLKGRAYMGEKITCLPSDFIELRRLELWNMKNLEEFVKGKAAMLNLANLVIRGCEKLIMEPDELKFVDCLPKETVSCIRGSIMFE